MKVKAQGINTEITKSVMHSGAGYGIYVELGALNVNINNNTMHNNSNSGIRFQSYASTIRDNIIVDNNHWGLQVNGRTADDEDNIIINNSVLRNADGISLFKQDSVLYGNTIKDNEGYGLRFSTSSNVYLSLIHI